MELILNINQYDYSMFLSSKINTIIIGIENFSCGYLKTYKLEDISKITKEIHLANKKIYLSFNIIASESTIKDLQNKMDMIKDFEVDGFVVSDFGIFQLFKENSLTRKIVFNPITNVTNKYSSKLFNEMGINHVCLANELNIKDILEVADYTSGNIEILAQGYYQICNSKRPLLTNFFKQFKLKSTSNHYYIKEESRDYAYPIMEVDNEIFVYIDKQRCILNYFKEIKNVNIKYIRIDTVFMDMDEINFFINLYDSIITNIENLQLAIDSVSKNNSNLKCLDNISILKKEKNNE